MSRETFINDFIVDVLVRYFRGAVAQGFFAPRALQHSTADRLAEYWALSREVRDLVSYLQSNVHELQAVLATEQQIHKDIVRGRLAARETQILRLSSRQPTWRAWRSPERNRSSSSRRRWTRQPPETRRKPSG